MTQFFSLIIINDSSPLILKIILTIKKDILVLVLLFMICNQSVYFESVNRVKRTITLISYSFFVYT